MPENSNQLASKTTLYGVLEALKENINYNLNCVKIATVEAFYPDNLTVSCKVANKRVVGIKDNGNQILQDYPLIYAKVHYLGWGDVGATFPITKGMEGILLFNDREIETWFLTGSGNNLAYDRSHNMSDAMFICGVHSLPNMIQIMLDCFHLFYKGSDIQIKDKEIISNTKDHTINCENLNINSDKDITIQSTNNTITSTKTDITSAVNITGDTTITGTTKSTTLQDLTGASGVFTSADGKIITVANGIIRTIVGA